MTSIEDVKANMTSTALVVQKFDDNSRSLTIGGRPFKIEEMFVGEDASADVIATITAKVDAFVKIQDVSTVAGRAEIRSFAYNVTRTKTGLDDLGEELIVEKRREVQLVNAERKKIRDTLDALAARARAALTEFEEREKKRVEDHELALSTLVECGVIEHDADVSTMEQCLSAADIIFDRQWEEFSGKAQLAYRQVYAAINDRVARRRKADADAAELAALRAAQAKRDAEDAERDRLAREQRIAEEAAEAARVEAEAKAERDRQEAAAWQRKKEEEVAAREATERAERARLERERQAAEERAARAEADAKAAEERRIRAAEEAEAQRKLDAAEAAVRERLAEARREQDRLDAIERERVAEERRERQRKEDAEAAEARARVRAEQAAQAERVRIAAEAAQVEAERLAREEDTKHRTRINTAAAAAFIDILKTAKVADPAWLAKQLVTSIYRGQIPHITISY